MKWPAGFMWGTGASSSQCEGAAPASDIIERERDGTMPVSGDGNGFATKYAGDFALYASLGLTHHRLSIEWARVEPEQGVHDPQALGHYRDILQAAHDSGVTPWITMHHFTLPKWFADAGGFNVEENRAKYWGAHTDFMAETFGDLAGGWKPVNETNYYRGIAAGPIGGRGANSRVVDEQIHLATCEAAATLRGTDKPVCSIYGLSGAIPMDDSEESAIAAEEFYADNWKGLGLARDGVLRMGDGVEIERPDLKGCFDLIGFSYYACLGFKEGRMTVYPEDAPVSPLKYGIWADGLGVVLDRLEEFKPGAPLLVSEYGVGTDDDAERAAYIRRGLEVTNERIERGADIRGFFHWTGVDNYEWTHGYDVKFGIIDVDRNVRPSAQVLATEALGS